MFLQYFSKIIIILILILSTNLKSFGENEFEYKINLINELFTKINNTNNDNYKLELNQKIINTLDNILNNEKSFYYDFSELNIIKVLTSDDNNLRVYNWNIALWSGEYKYFGYLQHLYSRNKINVFKLEDLSDYYNEDKRSFTSHKEWFGALYYEIITKKWNGVDYYTLIGWDGANMLINRKVVEVLYFTRKGLPQFGKKIFVVNNSRKSRLIFEYSNRATMLLRYNAKQDIIVIDHLSPSEPKFRGMRQYYGPDLSYDALEFRMGRWYYMHDIDPNIAINYERNRRINELRRQRRNIINR